MNTVIIALEIINKRVEMSAYALSGVGEQSEGYAVDRKLNVDSHMRTTLGYKDRTVRWEEFEEQKIIQEDNVLKVIQSCLPLEHCLVLNTLLWIVYSSEFESTGLELTCNSYMSELERDLSSADNMLDMYRHDGILDMDDIRKELTKGEIDQIKEFLKEV